ncbi:capsid assembly protein, partial [Herbiconiux daphne]
EEPVEELSRSEQGFEQMKADLVNRGLPMDELAQMQANFDATGQLTDQQYNRLAEYGHSKDFIDSYIRGQQALSQNYVNQFVASVGGIDQFQSVIQTLQQNSPKMISTLENAIGNRDLETAKAIIDLAGNLRKQTYGQPAQRTVTQRAVPVNSVPQVKQEGFQSKQEMVEAMNDRRYGRDQAYTMDVQRKVAYSPW